MLLDEVKAAMSIMIVLFVILIPLVMLCSAWLLPSCKQWFEGIAVVCAFVFGVITALAVYEILRDDTVFMTNIHVVFTNKLFLIHRRLFGCLWYVCLIALFLERTAK